jgi:hypothetical protein
MIRIDLADLDATLRAEMGADVSGFEAFAAEYPNATVANQGYHVVFHREYRRGGAVFVGSGASGVTGWTDADSADEVLERFVTDDMRA